MRRTVPLGVGALALVITGCAAIRTPSPVLCGLVGAAGGAGAGAGIGGANSDNGEGRNRGKGAAIGVFAGAVVGYALCSLLEKAKRLRRLRQPARPRRPRLRPRSSPRRLLPRR